MAGYQAGGACHFSVFFKADILPYHHMLKEILQFHNLFYIFFQLVVFAAEGEFANAPAQFDVYKNGNYDD